MFEIIGKIPQENPAETTQFERVLNILKRNQESIGPWAIIVLDSVYYKEPDKKSDGDKGKAGRTDMILLSQNKIILYELKGFTAKIIYGKTDNRNWRIIRWNGNKAEEVPSYFQQVSKNQSYLLQDFLIKYKNDRPNLSDCHWFVDARLVFKPESDLSGFFFRMPRKISAESLITEILPEIKTQSERNLIEKLYSGKDQTEGKLRSILMPDNEYKEARDIFIKYGIITRTQKWFGIITEKELITDLINNCGFRGSTLSYKDAIEIAQKLSN